MARLTGDLLRGAIAAHQAGDRAQAERLYRVILSKEKKNPDALHYLGLLRAENGQLDEAAQLIRQAVKFDPKSADLHANLGRVLSLLNKHLDAAESYEKALALNPDHLAALMNYAGTLLSLHLPQRALPILDRLLERDPLLPIALHNRCIALHDLARYDEVIAESQKLLSRDPKDADAWYKRGMAFAAIQRHEDAFKAFDAAFNLRPGLPWLEGKRLHSKMHVCDWSNVGEEALRLRTHVREGKNVASPIILIAITPSFAEQLLCAQVYVRNTYPELSVAAPPLPAYDHEKIRIAYLAGEFRDHATSYLTADLFECHDKSKFNVVGISAGPDDAGQTRGRVAKAFDEFIDVRNISGDAVARLVREKEIDILINLNGHAGDERTDVFRLKPAPVQVNFLGFPGTMGAPFMDYIIVDPTLVNDDEQTYFTERLVYLPDSYQPNDRRREISDRHFSRRDVGLPDNGFVYCCFNSSYKLMPEFFDIWMRVLREADDSVLWLLQTGDAARRNLGDEAERRGISRNRIVFAEHLPLPEHLSRLRLADLFLDTLPYNAHTTASDALWAGVPVLTCRGSTMAGRVAASLLRAIGLDELIMTSLSDYEGAAMQFAKDPALVADIKGRIQRNRQNCALFDTPRFARHIEAAFATMWQRHRRGEPPASFAVDRLAGPS